MNRIEEIKGAIKLYEEEQFTYAQGDHPDWSDDIQYLLSKLEIAEQFIKAVEIVSRIKEYEDLNKMSIDAIQLIRS